MPHPVPRGLQSKLLRRLTRYYGTRNSEGELNSPICQSVLSLILQGKRRATPEQAAMLERVLLEAGYAISKFDMVFAFKQGNPLLNLDKTKEGD